MVESYRAQTMSFKVLWYVIVIVILALIVVSVIIFYIPLIEQAVYRHILVAFIVIANVVFGLIARKKGWYIPSSKERRLCIVLIAIAIIAFLLVF